MQEKRLDECQEVIGYRFNDLSLLERALTHSSAKTPTHPSNERLEFLGDAILGLWMSEHLFNTYTTFDEGELTKIKSVVVSSQTLSMEAERMGLGRFVRLGRGIESNGPIPRSIVANLFEAITAAIFLDGGHEPARRFVLCNLEKHVATVLEDKHHKNYKSLLQQYAQKELLTTPAYQVVHEEGPDHVKTFEVVAVVRGRQFKSATGASKKEAEQLAAREALAALEAEAGRPAAEAIENAS